MALPTKMDMSDVKENTFEAIPAATYNATVFEVTEVEAPGTGHMPEGTPGINVQFNISDGEFENRRLFKKFYIAPDDYPKKDTMDSILYGFLKIALGEAVVKSKSFNLAKAVSDELFGGAPCRLKVTKDLKRGDEELPENEKTWYNNVKSVLAVRGSGTASSEGLLP